MRTSILLLLFVFLFSCNENGVIQENLDNESCVFFKKHEIDTIGFKKIYYIREDKSVPYKHYILKYFKILDEDSIIIWFTRDDQADYFIQTNDNFRKYYKK